MNEVPQRKGMMFNECVKVKYVLILTFVRIEEKNV